MVNLIKETLVVAMYIFPFIYFQNSYVHIAKKFIYNPYFITKF